MGAAERVNRLCDATGPGQEKQHLLKMAPNQVGTAITHLPSSKGILIMKLTYGTKYPLLFLVGIFALLIVGCSQEEESHQSAFTKPDKFTLYDAFIEKTKKSTFEEYANKPGSRVLNKTEFKKMQDHILNHYKGVLVKNSFFMEGNGYIDCIGVNTQPSLREGGKFSPIAKPPRPIAAEEKRTDSISAMKTVTVEPMLSKTRKDAFGNIMYCDNNYIPMRRLTLDELTRYKTLEDFFNKYGKSGTSDNPSAR